MLGSQLFDRRKDVLFAQTRGVDKQCLHRTVIRFECHLDVVGSVDKGDPFDALRQIFLWHLRCVLAQKVVAADTDSGTDHHANQNLPVQGKPCHDRLSAKKLGGTGFASAGVGWPCQHWHSQCHPMPKSSYVFARWCGSLQAFRLGAHSAEIHIGGDEQRGTVFAKRAVGRRLARMEHSQQLAGWREDQDAAGTGRPEIAVLSDGQAVGQSGTLSDPLGRIVKNLALAQACRLRESGRLATAPLWDPIEQRRASFRRATNRSRWDESCLWSAG